MHSSQTLHAELITLHRRLQAHYNQIEYYKSGINLLAALFNSHLRRQSLQAVANERRGIEQTLLQIQDVQEHHLAALFLECWQDELSHLPDSVFLSTTL
jgi:Fe2+ transport system protein B